MLAFVKAYLIKSSLLCDVQDSLQDSDFANEIREGLGAKFRFIRPKNFYDEHGSKLFERISVQPEYYLTRTESSILENFKKEIRKVHQNCSLSIVELGSGNSSKTKILLKEFLPQDTALYYFPIDVSKTILKESINSLAKEFKNLRIVGVCSDFCAGLEKVNDFISTYSEAPRKKLVIFLGSSIGNFDRSHVKIFLGRIRRLLNKGDSLLVGFDLQKERRFLEKAYNDKAGVTAQFNLNLLSRINRELAGEFDISSFKHEAIYNKSKKRIEMYLVSIRDQSVAIKGLGKEYLFKKGDRIHTENSHKFSISEINRLSKLSGFSVIKNYTDVQKFYCLSLLGYVSGASKSSK
jgi:dimethylhistidine N-methyltransferase